MGKYPPSPPQPPRSSGGRQQQRGPSPVGRKGPPVGNNDRVQQGGRPVDVMQGTLGSKDMDYRDKRMGDPRAGKNREQLGAGGGYNDGGFGGSGGPIRKELGFTGISTHWRFKQVEDTPDPKPRDLITIGIERNILGDEPAVISPVYRPEDVVIPRRRNEGEKPLHTRQEFVTREEEYTERRVIKVIKSADNEEDRYVTWFYM